VENIQDCRFLNSLLKLDEGRDSDGKKIKTLFHKFKSQLFYSKINSSLIYPRGS
jgi:hypothetical protein